jgi:hypothetical protein
MNPNLVLFFQNTIKVLIVLSLIGLPTYLLVSYTSLDWEKILSYLMYGFFGIVCTGMVILITGVTLKSVWVGIMHRADSIVLFCPDRNREGFHLVTTHYHSGGDSGDGYDSLHHYYISLDNGKMFLSGKIKDKSHLTRSLEALQKDTGYSLEPDTGNAIEIGSHHSDEKPITYTSTIGNYAIQFRGFESMIDFGFRIVCYKNEKKCWRRVV